MNVFDGWFEEEDWRVYCRTWIVLLFPIWWSALVVVGVKLACKHGILHEDDSHVWAGVLIILGALGVAMWWLRTGTLFPLP